MGAGITVSNVGCRMYGCVTKVSEYPNQTRYAEETEPRVSMTPWSIESRNHEHEMESQCQNQQGGYAPVWLRHLEIDKLSVQDKLWEVCVRHKLSSHKIIINEWAMPQCKHLQIEHQWEEYNQYTSSDQSEPLLLKAIVVMWREYLTSPKERACPNVNWYL